MLNHDSANGTTHELAAIILWLYDHNLLAGYTMSACQRHHESEVRYHIFHG